MRRIFMSPSEILQRNADGGGGGGTTTLEQVNEAVKGLKSTAEKAQEALKKQVSDLEAELKTKATAEEITAQKALIEKAQKDLTAIQTYAESLEKLIKEKPISDKVKSMTARIGDAVMKGWDQIKKFKDSNPGARVRVELFDEVELKAVADMGMANIVNLSTFNATTLPTIVTLPNTKVHMRTLIPTGSMDNTSITYLRETGGEGVPLPWAEATASATPKPQIDMDWIEVRMDAEYIAGWVRVSRKLLDDISAFRSFLQMRLMELYLNAEDAEILSGNGTSPHLSGLLTNASVLVSSATIDVEKIIDAIAQLESSKYTATGIIMHPKNFYAIAKNKAAGSGEYDLPGIVVIQGGQLYVAGIPVYKTTAMTYGTFLVGDFAQGCMLFIRENPRIEFFDQDRDNVITNKITVRIEGRAGLAIFQTGAFVKGTITATT
jgi:HK97 family phage major capsid protein